MPMTSQTVEMADTGLFASRSPMGVSTPFTSTVVPVSPPVYVYEVQQA